MSKWKQHQMEDEVRRALANINLSPEKASHKFGRPYITAYQLAIILSENNPDLCSKLEKQLGGKGTDEHHSLSQYVANELSVRIKNQEILDIEGVFLKTQDIVTLEFSHDVVSSATDTISLFRLKDEV